MVVHIYCNSEQIRCKWGLHSTAARFQMGFRTISPCIYSQILVPLRHLYTNAKQKFITTMDHCFNARHRSRKSVSARKMLITASSKFAQRLITTRTKLAKQRWSRVQDFCVGLADPSVYELASNGAKLWLGVERLVVNFARAENCPFLTAIFCNKV